MPKNDIKFQSQRHENDFGINMYSFKWREHDPQIGRFWQIDPLAADYVYNSPYAFSENKVVAHIELEGLETMGVGFLVDASAQGLSDAGYNRAAGFVSSYGHSLLMDPVYSTANAVETASTSDVYGTVQAFDPTGITSIPDAIATVGDAIDGDAYAQGQVLGMIPAVVGGFKAATMGLSPKGGPKVGLTKELESSSYKRSTNNPNRPLEKRSIENRETNVKQADFKNNLEKSGFEKTYDANGRKVLKKDGSSYTTRQSRDGTAAADYRKSGTTGKADLKIRLDKKE